MILEIIKKEVIDLSSKDAAISLSRFFKSNELLKMNFLGIYVPSLRNIVKKYSNLPLNYIGQLLKDKYHEFNLLAILFLINMFNNEKDYDKREEYFKFYCNHFIYINSWDLVDLSAPEIVGKYLLNKNREILYNFAKDENFWVQRIAIVATKEFIKNNDFQDTITISKILLNHKNDLIHKAVGWMLREVGKKNFSLEYNFLVEDKRYKTMPRTMLRYSIEKFPKNLKQDFLKGNI